MSKFYLCPRCKKQFQKDEHPMMCSCCGFQLSTYTINKSVKRAKVNRVLKPIITICIVLTLVCSGLLYLAKRSQIGKSCEDGGIIYFDKLFYSNGWRYLEVAPKNLNVTPWSETINEKTFPELKTGLGYGAHNSYNIIYRYGAKSAAYKAINYGSTDDWYLGTVKEMKFLSIISKSKYFIKRTKSLENFDSLITNHQDGKGNFIYWTSELAGEERPYAINFIENKVVSLEYSTECSVRPIRKF